VYLIDFIYVNNRCEKTENQFMGKITMYYEVPCFEGGKSEGEKWSAEGEKQNR
jgi:hypothetical protein